MKPSAFIALLVLVALIACSFAAEKVDLDAATERTYRHGRFIRHKKRHSNVKHPGYQHGRLRNRRYVHGKYRYRHEKPRGYLHGCFRNSIGNR